MTEREINTKKKKERTRNGEKKTFTHMKFTYLFHVIMLHVFQIGWEFREQAVKAPVVAYVGHHDHQEGGRGQHGVPRDWKTLLICMFIYKIIYALFLLKKN